MFTTRVAVILIAASAVISGVLGAAGGGEYVMRRVDVMDSDRTVERSKVEATRNATFQQVEQTAEALSRQLMACNSNFQASTVLYEPAPGLNISLSMRGLGLAPSTNQTPRWVIPARVKPLVVPGTSGGTYYYTTADNRLDGPYIPQIAPGGQQ